LDRTTEHQLFRARYSELVAEITETSFVEQGHAVMAMIRLTGLRLIKIVGPSAISINFVNVTKILNGPTLLGAKAAPFGWRHKRSSSTYVL
jgi:hypothetical protein